MKNSEIFYRMWQDFKHTLIYNDRYFNKHNILEHIENIVKCNEILVPKGEVLYRARIYKGDLSFIEEFEKYIRSYNSNDNSENEDLYSVFRAKMIEQDLKRREDTGFWGYNEQESHVPGNPDIVTAGRANPEKVRYLYLANEPICAIAEVRPLIENHVSLAEEVVLEDLKIADFTHSLISKVEEEQQFLAYILMSEYSKPNNGTPFEYITTQFISEFIKSLGYEGVKFNSSLYGRGRNFVIFNPDKCNPKSSKLYQLEDLCLDLKCVGPVGDLFGDEDLYHWKLEEFKSNRREKLKKKIIGKRP